MPDPRSTFTYPPELPVSGMRGEIAEAIKQHQVVIVAGETGSGKTTQLPKICLDLGRETIAHTQPRRLAARTIAERIAEETGTELGGLVGYQVRFTDQSSADTKIRLMTDGILLNAMHRDRDLNKYDTIIIDEAHERSLNIDFLLGYLKALLPRRPDLKLIITSATIDPGSFAEHFADANGTPAPIIEVSGRTYPVEIRYRPLVSEPHDAEADIAGPTGAQPKRHTEERDLFDAIGDAVAELGRESPGDVLVFLSGEAEIRDAADVLQGRFGGGSGRSASATTEILPLYGRLTAAEQHRVFEPGRSGARRIVLATNVAETSLTVPGIRYVIDAGTARISRYSARSKVQRLPIEAISQASANQRSGRSGRTSDGIAIRLYSEADFESRPEFTDPEIRRTGLASVILQMLSLGLGDIQGFPFLTPPDQKGIADGLGLLRELGAVRTEGHGRRATHQITKVGRKIARLPIEPRFARMLLEAEQHGVTREVIAIVAGLTIQDVRERPQAERAKADQLHARFNDPQGDLVTLLNLWNYLGEQRTELSGNAFRKKCRAEFLNYLRVREWMDLVRQLERAMRDANRDRRSHSAEPPRAKQSRSGDPGELASPKHASRDEDRGSAPQGAMNAPAAAPAEAIHRSMLAGLLSQIGVRDDAQDRRTPADKGARGGSPRNYRKPTQEYQGSRGTRFVLHPASVLQKQPPETIMTVELVETSRLFARSNAVIKPEWAEALAGPLAKKQLSEPHWERSQGAAVAYERVTLYGVTLVERRRVQLSRFNPELARELFIQHALVEGEWDSPQAFDRANRQLRRELEQLEERTRRRDIVADDEALFDFYDARIPADVASTRDFEGWWKRAQRDTPKLLHLRREDLLDDADEAEAIDEQAFPKTWRVGDQTLRLRYRFDPTVEDDGVTVVVPLPLLPRLAPADLARMVPGLREELVTALIRTLPKPIRKHVVPAADWARTLLESLGAELDAGVGPVSASPATTNAASDPAPADLTQTRPSAGAKGNFATSQVRGSLTELLAAEIQRRTSVLVSGDDFDLERLPAHLTPTYRVVDHRGKTIASSHDLGELQRRLRDRAAAGVAKVAGAGAGGNTPDATGPANVAAASAARSAPRSPIEQQGLTSWTMGDLPEHVDAEYAGGRGGVGVVRAYPALVDKRTGVDLVLVAEQAEQRRLSRAGLRRLVALSSPSPASYVREHLSNDEKLLLAAGPYRSLDLAINDVLLAVADQVIQRHSPYGLVWREAEFQAIADDYARTLIDEVYGAIALVARVLDGARLARRAIDEAKALHVLGQVTDAAGQLQGLVFDQFVSRTGLGQLARFPVYLEALKLRMQELPTDAGRDRTRLNEFEVAAGLYAEAGGQIPLPATSSPEYREDLAPVRWMLEEFRVSLFAQRLGTAGPVSLTRIRKALGA